MQSAFQQSAFQQNAFQQPIRPNVLNYNPFPSATITSNEVFSQQATQPATSYIGSPYQTIPTVNFSDQTGVGTPRTPASVGSLLTSLATPLATPLTPLSYSTVYPSLPNQGGYPNE